jgi:hypothetical protein
MLCSFHSGDEPGIREASTAIRDRVSDVTMSYRLLDTVVLVHDLPAQGLRRGDLGAVVEVYDDGAIEVEFVRASGKTQALVTLRAADVRAIDDGDLIAVRSLEHTG